MKRKNPEEIYSEILAKISEKTTGRDLFDNTQISIRDETEMEISPEKTLKEYLKEKLVSLYGRQTAGEYCTVFEITVRPDSVSVEVTSDPVFVCGRYRKNKRGISNTPMVFGSRPPRRRAQKPAEGLPEAPEPRIPAVSDWMDPITKHFGGTKCVFMSGGREDYDVRMLGNGRPFLCRIEDPKKNLPRKVGAMCTVISEEGCAVEEYVIEYKAIEVPYRMSRDVEVLQTCLVDGGRAMKEMKKIEEEHCKEYSVKVFCKAPWETVLERVQASFWEKSGEKAVLKTPALEIRQKTPIRVMHRRANLVRQKYLHACTVEKEGEFMRLHIKSSSGAYIKEFVNGDMGRTRPSLSEVVGEFCDVVELDVLSVEDTFPDRECVLAEVKLCTPGPGEGEAEAAEACLEGVL
ncbi:tRNA pseudouridine synthase 10 [Nematocida major]|uniref:tRNA pseudouridine synthase 10 n=1 Tax=Nematocida major TaxID=1912982 RepID=UPI002008CC36|nr:tRNA pseudouridine synthase 10 [Nematocida major]KAH9386181.1 tRNA pseudouridine synthase 10 [Nematocida major]